MKKTKIKTADCFLDLEKSRCLIIRVARKGKSEIGYYSTKFVFKYHYEEDVF